MHYWVSFAGLAAILALSYVMGRNRAQALSIGSTLHSLPGHYGAYTLLWAMVPAIALMIGWAFIQPAVLESMIVDAIPADRYDALDELNQSALINDIKGYAAGLKSEDSMVQSIGRQLNGWTSTGNTAMVISVVLISLAGFLFGRSRVIAELRARNLVEGFVMGVLLVASTVAIFTTVGIVLSLLFESILFFDKVPIHEFLFGLKWSPQTAMRADQVGSSGSFGAIPVFTGTLLISIIALAVAVPIGLFAAIYTSEYATTRARDFIKPVLEILAGIPTIVYGFFAALIVAPLLRDSGASMGVTISSESALVAGAVMGVMIIPFVSSLSDDAISAVPRTLREAAYGLGATKSETVSQVILPAAIPGIVGAILLAASRAIGETMIVVMAAGLTANEIVINPFEAVSTVTVQIVTLLTGDQEFDSAKTLSAFALGLVLFFVTLALNVFAQRIVQKYREKYD